MRSNCGALLSQVMTNSWVKGKYTKMSYSGAELYLGKIKSVKN